MSRIYRLCSRTGEVARLQQDREVARQWREVWL